MPISRLDSMVSFTPGYKKLWCDENQPVPDGVYIYDAEAKIIKIGNGIDLFVDLPIWLDAKNITQNAEYPNDIDLSMIGDIVLPDDVGDIIIASSEGTYIASGIKLQDIINSMTNINTTNSSQDDALNALNPKANEIDHIFALGEANSLNAIQANKITPLGVTPEANKTAIIDDLNANLVFNEVTILMYSDETLTTEVTMLDNAIFSYIKIDVVYGGSFSLNYYLTCDNVDVVITERTDLGDGIFQIDSSNVSSLSPITFTYIVDSGFSNTTDTFSFDIDVHMILRTTNIEPAITGELINKLCQDNNGYIYSVGYSSIAGGQGSNDGFIVKYDSDLNLIKQVLIGSPENENLIDICSDNNGYIYTVGESYQRLNPTAHKTMVWINKYDDNLNLITTKIFNLDANETRGICCKYDIINDKLVVGGLAFFSNGSECLYIATFNPNLNMINNIKLNDGWGPQQFYLIDIDYTDPLNVYYLAAGHVKTNNVDGCLAKFDTDLNFIKSVNYSGWADDYLYSIKVLPNGKYLVSGNSSSEGNTYSNPYIAIYNSDLTVDANHAIASHYGGHAFFVPTVFDETTNMIYAFGQGDYPFISQFNYVESVGITHVKTKIFNRQDAQAITLKRAIMSQNNTVLFTFIQSLSVSCSSLGELKPPLPDGAFSDNGSIYQIYDSGFLGPFYDSVNSVYDSTSEMSTEIGIEDIKNITFTPGVTSFTTESVFIGE